MKVKVLGKIKVGFIRIGIEIESLVIDYSNKEVAGFFVFSQ